MNRKGWQKEAEVVKNYYMKMGVSVLLSNRRKDGDQQFYVSQLPLLTAFKEFKYAHREIDIGIFTFQKLRPKNVHLQKTHEMASVLYSMHTSTLHYWNLKGFANSSLV